VSKKIALIEGGTYYHHFTMTDSRFAGFFDKIIYVSELASEDLSSYDVVMIADRTHQKFLKENAQKLEEYAKNGGTLCILGENGAHLWFEGINYKPTETNFWWWLDSGGDIGYKKEDTSHPFFENIRLGECKWHYHGVFEPGRDAKKIIERKEEEGGGTILFEEPYGKGRIVATSLDPFYHTGSNFMPNAAKFLSGVLRWLKD